MALISVLDGDEWSALRPASYPGEGILSTHCIGGWAGPRSTQNAVAERNFSSERWQRAQLTGRSARSVVTVLATLLGSTNTQLANRFPA